jgi:hypothetical protein
VGPSVNASRSFIAGSYNIALGFRTLRGLSITLWSIDDFICDERSGPRNHRWVNAEFDSSFF